MDEELNYYHDLFKLKWELHKLMRRVIRAIKNGIIQKMPDDDIYMDIGNGTLNSCMSYEQVRYTYKNTLDVRVEYELDNNLEVIECLIAEIETRFKEFQNARKINKNKYNKGKKLFAKNYFDKPLTSIKYFEEEK